MKNRSGRTSKTGAREAGVLLHVTSLPGGCGVGDLGAGARRFAEFAASCGFSVWQILPLHPVDASGSPYSGLSAFAGNPLLLDLEDLVARGLLARRDLRNAPAFEPGVADHRIAAAHKLPLIARAASALLAGRKGGALEDRFAAFCGRAGPIWLDDAALYAALAAKRRGRPWWRWERPLKFRHGRAIRDARAALAGEIEAYRAFQFLFDVQWRALVSHCADLGVKILGDVPLYVAREAVDVWARPELFALDRELRPRVVAGVPPDYFSEKGQCGGTRCIAGGRTARSGFAGGRPGSCGARARGPGAARSLPRALCVLRDPGPGQGRPPRALGEGAGARLLAAATAALGGAPFVAEDLGVIDGDVLALRDAFDLPGMAVLQFGFGESGSAEHLPENHRERQVVYTGTHDNDTLIGWWRSAGADVRDHVRRHLALRGGEREVARRLVREVIGSVARLAVIPMQDLLGLGSEARMNTPGGRLGSSWTWRLQGSALTARSADRIREMVEASGR